MTYHKKQTKTSNKGRVGGKLKQNNNIFVSKWVKITWCMKGWG